jgi:hypothetical protein
MTTLVFFLEEYSAQVMLESFLPKLIPSDYEQQYVVFEGKTDLEKRLARRLLNWKKPGCKFIVLRDQDSAVCTNVKINLQRKCGEGQHPEAMVRIACHELESWYLGDLQAVEDGLKIQGLAKLQQKSKYRNPDTLTNPAEELAKITKRQYQKISGSRQIGKYLQIDKNSSHSFKVFIECLEKLCGD